MPVPSAYLTKTGNVASMLAALQRAGVPERFTYDFLQKQLGFTSSSDRPIIPVLKALRFLDDSGAPLDRYRRYKDPSQAPLVLAEALRDAYADVFAGDQNAHTLSSTQLTGMFARLSGKGEGVSQKMASTFKALSDLADFSAVPGEHAQPLDTAEEAGQAASSPTREAPSTLLTGGGGALQLRHDVHIHLPSSTDIAVYDAVFRSLRENLL
jgi:hypothetical protein